MLIRRLKLSPFGGVKNRELVFAPGLNVVLGPNEAGKSTLVNALFAVLFLSSGLRKSDPAWKNCLSRSFPYGGGDTVSVLVEFLCREGKEHTLSRSWGAKKEDRLELTGGAVVHTAEQIRQILSAALGHGQGTYEGVLFARQDEMIRTVELLQKNEEVAATLSELLRAAIFQTGGVSLEALAAALDEEKKELLNLWDIERDGPKDNKGYDRQWVKGCGSVLKAYYEVEGLKRGLQDTAAAEKQLEEVKAQLLTVTQEKQQVELIKTAMEKIEDDIRQRDKLETGFASLKVKAKTLKQVNVEWPLALAKFNLLENEEEQFAAKREQLERELEEAKVVLATRAKRELFNIVKPWIDEISTSRAELQQMQNVSAADLKWLEVQFTEINERRVELQAMKLQARMTAVKSMLVQVTTGLDRRETVTVDSEVVFNGEGRLRLEHSDWVIEVQSGQADVPELLAGLEKLETSFREKLQELGVVNLAEACVILAARTAKENNLTRLQALISSQLKDGDPAVLAADVAELPPDVPVRETMAVLADMAGIDADRRVSREKAAAARAQIEAWEKEYGQHDDVMNRLADVLWELRESEGKLNGLAPLPAEFPTAETFLIRLREIREKSRNADQALYDCKLAFSQAEKALPESSAEEIAQQLTLATEKMARLKKRALLLLAVEKKFRRLAESLDANTFAPFTAVFARYLAPATAYRYQAASLDGALPGRIMKAGGGELPIDLLSAGTTRGVALALRLAMAEYLLAGAKGFMVMDDPLVDLDPERKRHAAEMIGEYAKDRQLLILTCDPETARLLGGSLTDLAN